MENGAKLISIPPIETKIPEEVYSQLEAVIWDEVNKTGNPDDALASYIYPFENIQAIAESDNIEYKENIRKMADDVWGQEAWLDALLIYYILMHIITFIPPDFYKLAYTLGKLNRADMAIKLIEVYESVSTNQKVTYHALANFYYTAVNIPYKAIEYFEKYLEIDDSNPNVYNTLGHLYGSIGDEVSDKKQLDAFLKAYELKPDDSVIVKSLLTAYEKRHNEEKVKELYPELIKLAPSPRHSLNYGLYLISWGHFHEGHKYFTERFDLDNYPVGYPKSILGIGTRWNYTDDISDKTLLIHYEEGFGDSIMYSRFVPLVKQYAKNTVFVVQPELVDLFKQSPVIADGIEIMGDIKDFVAKYKNEKYLHMPLMDTPYPLGVDTHFIPYTGSYIESSDVDEFDENKFNIGIAYSGDLAANYNGRDIELKEFYNLARMDGVQLYSLQVGKPAEQLKDLPDDVSIIDLGKDFKNFTDTANAIMGLDLIITTDNVILNLAGAMRKVTYGIFNKYPNYRWFDLTGKNVRWYESVRPFQCAEENDWASAMKEVEQAVAKRMGH
ncbi:MAG: hypothetical protein K6E29_06715 [Cyanobacteria bacterium RUI128]|nr:hypothetical protein [Cyanobacteria bacterium RUI128]